MKQTYMPLETFKAISFTMTGGLDQRKFSETLKRYCPAGKGISQSSVSNFLKGKPISRAAATRVNASFEKWQEENGSEAPNFKVGGDYEAVTESPTESSREFRMVTPVVKGEGGKFQSLADVDLKMVALPKKTEEMYHPDATEEATTLNPAMYTPTDEELLAEMLETFDVMKTMTRGCLTGTITAMAIYGPAGLGKSHPTFEIVNNEAGDTKTFTIKGSMSAPGLYKTLYKARNGGLVLIDDCDSVFGDEECLNYLKAALDTSDVRTISCEKEARYVYDEDTVETILDNMEKNEDGEEVESDESFEKRKSDKRLKLTLGKAPNRFNFDGRVIFITNKNLLKLANGGTKVAEHVSAIVSRSLYLDLDMESDRQKIVWVEYIFNTFMWDTQCGLTREQADELFGFIKENYKDMQEISNRLMKIASDLYKLGPNWRNVIRKTKMKRKPRYIAD